MILLREGLDRVRSNLSHAVECGVVVLTGTDMAVGTHQVAEEAIRLWEMGMAPAAAVDAVSFAGFKWVVLKMLPLDNKSEFQVVLDMPEGTTLAGRARDLERDTGGVPPVAAVGLTRTRGRAPDAEERDAQR